VKQALVVAILVVVAALRVWSHYKRRTVGQERTGHRLGRLKSDVALVAAREIRERLRGRIFRVGTLLILAGVAAAIVIPTLDKGKPHPQRIGVVGGLAARLRATVVSSARTVGTTVDFVSADERTVYRDLRSGCLDLGIVAGRELVVDKPIGPTDTSATAQLVLEISKDLGVAEALQAAHLSPAQSSELARAGPLPVHSLEPGARKGAAHSASLIGLILVFLMLSQYNTWILMGVMEEKSSRVIEVLLAAVRPIQLLAGKVLGIGLVACFQASLIVAFALLVAKGVGSDLLHGTAPVVLVSTLAWLVLGYCFYCWVYAAAGSLAERQDQVQTLALPLSLPIIFGYVMSITAISSGNPSALFKVLAYLPPTAPFAMPVLVGLGAVSWWEFLASAVISVVCTLGVARLASVIYKRAILRTGARVKLRDVLGRTA